MRWATKLATRCALIWHLTPNHGLICTCYSEYINFIISGYIWDYQTLGYLRSCGVLHSKVHLKSIEILCLGETDYELVPGSRMRWIKVCGALAPVRSTFCISRTGFWSSFSQCTTSWHSGIHWPTLNWSTSSLMIWSVFSVDNIVFETLMIITILQ